MKTANLAIVLTDIKGFTERTSGQTLEENQRLLALHSRILTPLFRTFGGRVVKSIGDAFLVTFESPTQAVLCGCAIQDRLWSHNRSAPPKERFDVRVAVNVGEVRVEGGDVFGEPVNIASRVEGLAEAGQVWFTEAVYLAMNKAEVPAVCLGDFELRGVPGAITIFRATGGAEQRTVPGGPESWAGAPFKGAALAKAAELEAAWDPARAARGAVAMVEVLGEQAKSAVGILADRLAPGRPARGMSLTRVLPPSMKRPRFLIGLGLLLLGALWVGTRRSAAEVAIEEARKAPVSERRGREEAARRLIEAEKAPANRSFLLGLLNEAVGQPEASVSDFQEAAKLGHRQAKEKLADLLGAEGCDTRRAAARAVGQLRMKEARPELEDLAENGGPGEGQGGFLGLGCDSRRAAADALKKLE